MLKQIRKLVKRYKLARGSIDSDRLAEIIKQHGYNIIKINRYNNEPDIENLLKLLNMKEITEKEPSSAYADDDDNRIVFIRNGLSDEEYEILYWHELAHIVQGHVYSRHNSIREEDESNRFVNYTKIYIAAMRTMKYFISAAFVIILVFLLTFSPNNNSQNPTIFSSTEETPQSDSTSILVTAQPTKSPTPISSATPIKEPASTAAPRSTPAPVSEPEPESINSPEDAAYFAYENLSESEIVYVTKTGKRFHKSSCYHIKNSSVLIDLSVSKAIELKYTPCKNFYRELY